MGYIYMLTSPKGKTYIGQTTRSIHKRLGEHESGHSTSSRGICGAIKKYGWSNFEKHWYECPVEDLNNHEELMVEVLGTLTPDGYNLRDGGGNSKMSEESRQKMSKAKQGEKNHNFGIPRSDETKQKMSEAAKRITKSDDHRQNISKAQFGDKNHRSKRVYQYAHDGAFIASFGSIGEAVTHLKKKDGSRISKCARGVRGYKNAYKFKWSYTLDIFI